MRNEIADFADRLKHELARVHAAASAMSPTPTVPAPRNTISNFGVLRKAIKSFYGKNETAPYLPSIITSGVKQRLAEIEAAVRNINTAADDPEAAKSQESLLAALEKMDEAYAFCLQYGIISFGFDAKVIQEQVNLVRAAVTDVENEKAVFVAKLAEITGAFTPSVDEAKTHALAAKATADALETELAAARTTRAAIDDLHANVTVAAKAATEDSVKAGTAFKSAETSEKLATASAAAAKQSNTESAEAKAVVEGRRDAITTFFTEITTHRETIVATQKQAGDDAAALKKKTHEDVEAFEAKTKAIIVRNDELQVEIKSHLAKAVPAGLFSAFEARRKGARNAGWWWATLLIVATICAAGGAIFLANEFASGRVSGGVLLARLVVAIPVGFLITFLAAILT